MQEMILSRFFSRAILIFKNKEVRKVRNYRKIREENRVMLRGEFENGRRLQRSLCLVATALGCERKTIFIFVLKAAVIFFSFFYKFFVDFILILRFQSVSSSSNHIG